MFETNEEIIQKLKLAIHDYYMGHIKHKLKFLLVNDKENEISSHIMQFLDAQIDTGNYIIVKDDIVKILNSVFFDSTFASDTSTIDKERITFAFPYSADVTIEDGRAALLTEKFQTPFNGIEEKSYYLYIAPEFYDKNIKGIEEQIKKLEKTFLRQDFRNFEKEYNENLNKKQYELESAKVYESACLQIELKKQKFNQVSQKMINEYGKKYDEIMARDISDYEKTILVDSLFLETKSFDEKNRVAVSRLNLELEKLHENFKDKVQDSKTIYSQMQNLHLFDKNRYFEDMMAAANPELRDLYRKRYLLNSYRKNHGEFVYDRKVNPVLALVLDVLTKLRRGKAPLMLGPHFERDFPSLNASSSEDISYDKDLLKALAKFYASKVLGENEEFENSLLAYFKEHYSELMGNNYKEFLSEFSRVYSENSDEGDLFKIARQFMIDNTPFEDNFSFNLVIQDGLIYEDNNGLNIIYSTDKAINEVVQNLYSSSLYYKHLARENNKAVSENTDLQNAFVNYANEHGIEILDKNKVLKHRQRFVKKKNSRKYS